MKKIDKSNVAAVLALTPLQEGLLYHYLRHPEGDAYLEQIRLRLKGCPDPARVRDAWRRVVAANPMLRAVFRWQGIEHPVQIVLKHHEPEVRVEDQPAGLTAEDFLAGLQARDRAARFDFEGVPLRLTLCRLDGGSAALLLSNHHILMDGWSTGLVLAEFLEAYRILAGGGEYRPAPKGCFENFVRWLQSPPPPERERFWRQTLAGYQPLAPLADGAGPGSGLCRCILPADLEQALKALAGRQGVTLAGVLYTAWGLLLQKYAGSTDVVFGTTVSGRSAPLADIERSVGLFINTLPLRFCAAGGTTLAECLHRVHRALLERSDWEHTPLADIQRWSGLAAGESLFDSLVVIENYPLDRRLGEADGALAITGCEVFERTHYDLTLTVQPHAGLSLTLACRGLDGARLLDRLQSVLRFLHRHPEAPVSRLDLLTGAEQAALQALNRTRLPFAEQARVPELIAAQAGRTPQRPALAWASAPLSYAALWQRAQATAAALADRGVGPGALVAVHLEPGPELISALLGVWCAGAAYLPLDPALPRRRVDFILEDSGARHLIGRGSEPVELPGAEDPAGDGRLAYLIYTSGSTGQPKGVRVSHRNLVNFLTGMAARLPLGADDTLLALTTVSFDIFGLELWLPLSLGAQVALGTREEQLDPMAAAERILRDRVTVYQVTPSRLRLQLEAPAFCDALGRLNTLLVGGEPFPADLLERIGRLTAARVFNLYGPTETTIWSTVAGPGAAAADSIGTPIANTSVYVLAPTGSLQPPGLPGELGIGGEGVALGYHRREALTRERFIDTAQGRLYRSGDLGYWQDGRLVCRGRLDHQLKLRGLRIEPGEIEQALARHGAVREAVVVKRDGPAGPVLAGYWTPRTPAQTVSAAELKAFLGETLPDYLVPEVFVQLPALPLTATGKLDRTALPEPGGPLPAPTGYAAPRSEAERRIAQIWQGILGVERVGLDDRFFDLGGNSFGLIRLHGRLARAFERPLSVVELFQYPTVRTQAAYFAPAAEPPPRPDRPGLRGDVAVIGMAGRFPGAPDLEAFWRLLLEGREGIRFFSDEELAEAGVAAPLRQRPGYVRAKGYLDQADSFDADFFGLSPREAALTDPQLRLLLECAWESLENAGYAPRRCPGEVGLYVGASANYRWLAQVGVAEDPAEQFGTLILNEKDYLATRVAYWLNLTGPAVTLQTACSTSLVAIDAAAQALLAGRIEMAVAGGVGLTYPLKAGYLYEAGMIFSPDGHCRAFDAEAAGTVAGNGVGLVVLKRLADAEAAGDPIRAVLKGSAVNNDGADKVGFTAPSVQGQARAITAAHRAAGIAAETIAYVETHGSGTPLGDPVEVAALTRAFATERRGFCALGSVKTNIGHLDTAAGVAGFIKIVLALEQGVLPPSLHFRTPNPRIDFADSPFFVNTEARPWPAGLRRAGVSSFGVGGTNAHAVLEQAPAAPERPPTPHAQLLLLSARTDQALEQVGRRLSRHLAANPALALADVAYTLHAGRALHDRRRFLVCADTAEAAARTALPEPAKTASAGRARPPVIFLFGGLGAQYPAMCRGLYQSEPVFRHHLDRCFDGLRPQLELKPLLFADGPAGGQALGGIEAAQAAIFGCEYALARLLLEWGIEPAIMLGYSFGEYVAACIAGVFTLEDALGIVLERGRLLRETPPGSMLSLPLPAAEALPLLEAAGGGLALAVDNGPSCVIAGPCAALAEFAAAMKRRRLWCTPVAAERAVHSPGVAGAAHGLQAYLARCRRSAPAIPFVSNLSGEPIAAAQAMDPAYWARHLCHTVRFAAGLRYLLARHPDAVFLELGPGRELLALLGHHTAAPDAVLALNLIRHPGDPVSDTALLLDRLGRLFLRGVVADAEAFYRGRGCRRVPLPGYPFERRRYWPAASEPAAPAGGPFYRPGWKRVPAQPPAPLAAGASWLVIGAARDLAETVVQVLQDQGQRAGAAAVEQPLEALLAGPLPDHIVHLATLPAAEREAGDALERLDRITRAGFHWLVELARALAARDSRHRVRIHVVTSGAADITGESPLRPETALLRGPVQVIPLEYPQLDCRLLDAPPPPAEAAARRAWVQALSGEWARPQAPREIAVRGAYRWQPAYEAWDEAELAAAPSRLRTGGVYLLTGGLGGIGLALAERLAQRYRARLVLVGRRALGGPGEARAAGVQARLLEMERAGAEVLVEAADVTDEGSLRAVVERARARFGAIDGVIHAAGIADGGLIQTRARGHDERVLAAKTRGTLTLERVLREQPPQFVVLFSSISSILAPYGQVAYVGANAFLDAYAQARRGAEPFVLAVNWDAWAEVGMAVDMARTLPGGDRRLTAHLDSGLTTRRGLDALERLLGGQEPQVVVSTLELTARLARHQRHGGLPPLAESPESPESPAAPVTPGATRPRPDLVTAYAPPGTPGEQRLVEAIQTYQGLDRVGIDDNFLELGLSSLDLIQLAQRLQPLLAREISAVELFQHPTVRGLAAYLEPAAGPALRERGVDRPRSSLDQRRQLKNIRNQEHG